MIYILIKYDKIKYTFNNKSLLTNYFVSAKKVLHCIETTLTLQQGHAQL